MSKSLHTYIHTYINTFIKRKKQGTVSMRLAMQCKQKERQQNYVKEFSNRYVLSLDLKELILGERRISNGRAFQSFGEATEKARSP